mmetsp:Transcript_5415/g.4598  ORF Transcript_5415/g.4598 Transcript_5415/m.4598 type:complete len:194 (+) Transcript_5415:218-799(+)|eukprot:CAMPEP_0114579546 /NCGR_PEP_ID=MMETSP0125-20121206/3877_1 /TAXON_ID=485358 ORGANISM="Aristerostoma sp., Strain ATCC 50986" /NCGR_SAMPLE_ID=MMETSP0125 /ASSEMBLY_ACC=CAM_ASM_000245 /LENGTH=193 /DNA_ID=CAMNT_0001770307 /DNA_START=316 /DNA_END=897 /DNA_ORIENTATION=-
MRSGTTSPDRLVKENETLFETLEQEMKTRFELEARVQEVIADNNDLRQRFDEVLHDFEMSESNNRELSKKIDEMNGQLEENGEVIRKLVDENTRFKEQIEFSEKLEDIEKYREALQDRDHKIKTLTDELSVARDNQYKTSRDTKRYINDVPSERTSVRQNMVLDNQLNFQSTLIANVQQAVFDAKKTATEVLG